MHYIRHRARKRWPARHVMTVLLAATVLTVIAAPLSIQDESAIETAAPTADRAPALVDAQRGMRIHLDEQGRPVAPPPDASRAAVRASSVTAAPPVNLVELDTPRGGKMVVLDGRFQPYSVAHIRSDGTVAVDCERRGDHGHSAGSQPAACTASDAPVPVTDHAGASQ